MAAELVGVMRPAATATTATTVVVGGGDSVAWWLAAASRRTWRQAQRVNSLCRAKDCDFGRSINITPPSKGRGMVLARLPCPPPLASMNEDETPLTTDPPTAGGRRGAADGGRVARDRRR
jgi:hypothetical protein